MGFQRALYVIFWIVNFIFSLALIALAFQLSWMSSIYEGSFLSANMVYFGDWGHFLLLCLGIFYLILTVRRPRFIQGLRGVGRKSLIASFEDGSKVEVLYQTFNDTIKAYMQELEYVKRASVITYQNREGLCARIKLQVFVAEGLSGEIQLLKSEIMQYLLKTFGVEFKQVMIILA